MEAKVELGNLNKSQLEILKLFSRDISEADLKEIKRLIVNYLAKNLTELADKKWDEENWSNEDTEKFLNTHKRTPYNSKN